jgi:hypothetical protein
MPLTVKSNRDLPTAQSRIVANTRAFYHSSKGARLKVYDTRADNNRRSRRAVQANANEAKEERHILALLLQTP